MAISLPQNFFQEKITLPVSAGATNIYISNAPTADSGILVLSPANSSKREIVRFTAKGSDGSGAFITVTAANRGLGGTTDQSHSIDEPVFMNVTAEHFAEIDTAIEAINTNGALDASSTTKGIAKLSVAPVDPADPKAVGDNDPRIPNADVTAALLGTQSAPSASNRFITEETLWKEIDQEQSVQDSSIQSGQADTIGNRNNIVQSFTPSFDKIRGVKLNKQADAGTFVGDVVVELFANDAGNPDTATVLATRTITNAEWVTIKEGEFEVLFTTEYTTMVVGDIYWIRVSTSTADSSNYINLGTDSGASYTDGELKFNNTTDGYVSQAADLYFKTLRGYTGLIRGLDIQEFSFSGVWKKPEGVTKGPVIVEIWGAGGSGGATKSLNDSYAYSTGGGGGAYVRMVMDIADLDATETVTVGLGGAATVSAAIDNSDADGLPGGSSWFKESFFAAAGGGGGDSVSSDSNLSRTGGVGGAALATLFQSEAGSDGGDINTTSTSRGAQTVKAGVGGSSAVNRTGVSYQQPSQSARLSPSIGGASIATGGTEDIVAEDGQFGGGGGGAAKWNNTGTATSGKGGDGFVRVTTIL
jgi:hypothetical protein